MDERPLSIRARRRVKEQMEKYEKERLLALFNKRMSLAREGAGHFKQGKYKEALTAYYQYLDILEKTKEVKSGGLEPRLFDQKKDIAELLLLTGVFWDMAKIMDRVKDDHNRLEQYIDRFILFSKGMPYQHISSELVRKYLINGIPRNRKVFKSAHLRLGGAKCFLVTAVEDFCEPTTLPALREFRDVRLARHWAGRAFIRVYYGIGPILARALIRAPEAVQRRAARFFDRLSSHLDAHR